MPEELNDLRKLASCLRSIPNYKKRICPICERKLEYKHYFVSNFSKMADSEKLMNRWNNLILAIPCCYCYELIESLKKSKYDIRRDGENYELCIEYKKKISFIIISERMFGNLQLYGILEE